MYVSALQVNLSPILERREPGLRQPLSCVQSDSQFSGFYANDQNDNNKVVITSEPWVKAEDNMYSETSQR